MVGERSGIQSVGQRLLANRYTNSACAAYGDMQRYYFV